MTTRIGLAGLSVLASLMAGPGGPAVAAPPLSHLPIGTASATVSAGQGLTWAVWGSQPTGNRAVLFGLVRSRAGVTKHLWDKRYPGGYTPSLAKVDGWMAGRSPVVVLRYSLDAEHSEARMFALGSDGRVNQVGSLSGPLITPMPNGGSATYRVYDTKLLEQAKCYGWNAQSRKLVEQACPSP